VGLNVSSVGVELRRRRTLLGWSQVVAAKRPGVSRNIINEVEAGKRRPSIRTYEKLRDTLGLQVSPAALVPPRPRTRPEEHHLVRLAAAGIAVRECSLATLAAGLGIAIPAVREGVLGIADRLAAVGVRTFDDGAAIRLSPTPEVEADVAAVTTVEDVETLSADALAVLMVLGTIGEGTRRDVEDWRHEDSAGILERLRRRGFIAAHADEAALGQVGPALGRRGAQQGNAGVFSAAV